jgi:subtilisin family serine protease
VLVGIDWLLDQRVRIVCFPFGTPDRTPIFSGALEALERAGILVVAAVGNRGAGTAASPAERSGALAVGAVDDAGQVPRFSGGRSIPSAERTVPDLVAPGCDVVTTMNGGGYVAASGTSIAAAWVAGVAALLLQAHPNCPPGRLTDALRAGARPLPGIPRHRAGCGVVDPEASLAWLEEPRSESPSARAPTVLPEPRFCDPRLQVQLSTAAPDTLVEALVLVRDSGIGTITQRLAADLCTSRVDTIELPRLRTLFVRARPEFLRLLTTSSEVAALSASDTFAGVLPPPWQRR